jgi:hypothetical protein
VTGPLEAYLAELASVRASGAGLPETSYYPALANLFDAVGRQLQPRVHCVMQLRNRGAGLPDGGFFTAEQLRTGGADGVVADQLPARGALEIKPASDDALATAGSEQVARYCARYRQVLVTNLREFVLVGSDGGGPPVPLEKYCLAADESAFWRALDTPHALVARHEHAFTEYLQRVLLHAAALGDARDLAWFLASYARDARARVEGVPLPALEGVRSALEEALGLRFEGPKGERFFRSSLVQTLFYGVFAAWAIWARRGPATAERFDWRLAAYELQVPVLRKLFHEVADPGQLELLRLTEVLQWACGALRRVDRPTFFASFVTDHAVQYFYEPFLEAYDPQLRKDLGVWYTPPEIVRYMVARVDRVLRDEMGLPDGLADERVHVLDPAAGTGSFLVEVLRRIHTTLQEKEGAALAPSLTRKAALERVSGFEILPAPFVVAHLQVGLLLQELGAPLDERAGERAGVYLTNALTGWDSPTEPKTRLLFPELQAERDLAQRVKRDTPILVVLGNPPYNAFAGVSPAEEQGLVAPYKKGLVSSRGVRKFNLDELYVRFLRVAERRIAEMTGRGVIAFISSFSYLSDPSFVVLRERFLREFDALWFDCLNGDSRETGKRTPDGRPDPSVFSSEYNRAGIRLGTVVGVMLRKSERAPAPVVRYRDFWGRRKREDVLASLEVEPFDAQYRTVRPEAAARWSFRPRVAASQGYESWPRVVELCAEAPISGLQEMRRGDLMAIDRERLERRMRAYFDRETRWPELVKLAPGLTRPAGRYDPKTARKKLLKADKYEPRAFRRYALHPLDVRWCYHATTRPLWNEPRPNLVKQAWHGNRFLVVRMFAERPHEHVPMTVASVLPDYHLLRPNAVAIPFEIRRDDGRARQGETGRLFASGRTTHANLSPAACAWLEGLGVGQDGHDGEAARLVWLHVLAVAHSPAYLRDNAGSLRHDWPRVPVPATRAALEASAALGARVAALVDVEQDVPGVTDGTLRPELRRVALPARHDGRPLDARRGDLRVTAGWGHAGARGVVMPGRGRLVRRPWGPTEIEALSSGVEPLALDRDLALAQLGATTCDVHLNEQVFWSHVPEAVWAYTIGGYQVLKKWLSYREAGVLGRDLSLDELRAFSQLARRLAALALLQPALDANYAAVGSGAVAWRGAGA